MSTRPSLQSYQEQLAQRLADTERTGRTADWLALRLGGHDMLLPLTQSGEIHPSGILQPLPLTAPWVLGVTGLRGTLTLLVDLARWWGWPSPADRPVALPGSDALATTGPSLKWVGVHPSLGLAFAFPVEQLRGLRHRSEFTPLEQPAPPDSERPGLSRRWVDPQDQLWREIDLQALAQSPDFLDIRTRGLTATPPRPVQPHAAPETPHV